ncbi:hypothetical protein NDU88_005055 [Pleurodeles waltl]|uniref:Uncharacterized protein n=1 Tax=Pleurodeles waltl TaxID=8319 RepID=A0AAV7QE87_PLEWA|nr:hypothetical protein NDU88_005055 [Pleurodeles waltl]
MYYPRTCFARNRLNLLAEIENKVLAKLPEWDPRWRPADPADSDQLSSPPCPFTAATAALTVQLRMPRGMISDSFWAVRGPTVGRAVRGKVCSRGCRPPLSSACGCLSFDGAVAALLVTYGLLRRHGALRLVFNDAKNYKDSLDAMGETQPGSHRH